MNLMQVRGKMRRIRAELEEDEETSGELNLVPYLDISTNVVMFLLLTISFGAPLAQITINTPKLTGGSGADRQRQSLNLVVGVSQVGFVVNGADEELLEPKNGGKRIPKIGEEYNWPELTSLLVKLKTKFPEEQNVVVVLNPQLPYETLVRTFDAVRQDGDTVLFPNPALGVEE